MPACQSPRSIIILQLGVSLAAIRTRDEGVFMITLVRICTGNFNFLQKIVVYTAGGPIITYGREENVSMIRSNGM